MGYNFDRLMAEGITFADASALRRIAMTLHRWHELECGDGNNYASWCIVRGKKTGGVFEYSDDGKPYEERHIHSQSKPIYTLMVDREKGALARLAKIMAKYPKLNAYVQGDPRGASLYIGKGLTDSNYSQGIAVYR